MINPVDFAGVAEEEPEAVPRVLDACLTDPDVGGAILAGHFGGYFKIATPELGRREVAAARDAKVQPRVVIYDPNLTVGLPAKVSGPSGMNAIAHCVEALYAENANPIRPQIAQARAFVARGAR